MYYFLVDMWVWKQLFLVVAKKSSYSLKPRKPVPLREPFPILIWIFHLKQSNKWISSVSIKELSDLNQVTFEKFKASTLTVGVPWSFLFNYRCTPISISVHAMSFAPFLCHFGTFCQNGIGRRDIGNMHLITCTVGRTPFWCHRYTLSFLNRKIIR